MKKIYILEIIIILYSIFPMCIFGKEEFTVTAKYAIAIDGESGRTLYEKNSTNITAMASTTKIMTALIAIKYGDLDKEVTISENSARIGGSTVGYRKDEKITIRELLYGLMHKSGNDAAIAIAEGISGSVDEFLKLMNEYAKELGLLNTNFETPNGLDSENHYTNVYDLAMLTREAKKSEEFNKIVSTKLVDKDEYNFSRSYNNINKLIYMNENCNGVKTGFTFNAGKCLVSSFKNKGRDIIIVVLNCDDRWAQSEKIYNYVVENYELKQVVNSNDVFESEVDNGTESVKLKSEEDVFIPIKKGSEVSVSHTFPSNIKLPVHPNEKMGSLHIYEDKKLIFSKNLTTQNNVRKKKSLKNYFKINTLFESK